MQKIYISALDLLAKMRETLWDRKFQIPLSFPSRYQITHHENEGVFLIYTYEVPDQHALIQVVRSRVPSYLGLGQGVPYHIPYIMELEYIKRADLGLTDQQLEMLNQLFLILVFSYGTRFGRYLDDDDIQERWSEDTQIYDPEDPESLQALCDQVEAVYAEHFQPMEVSPAYVRKKYVRSVGAYPISLKDAFLSLGTIYTEEEAGRHWGRTPDAPFFGQALLFTPLMLTFYLLERRNDGFQGISWGEYTSWMEDLPDNLDPVTYRNHHNIPEGRTLFTGPDGGTTPQVDGRPLSAFSYGYVSYQMDVGSTNDDQAFLLWLFDLIFWTIMEQSWEHCITDLSVKDLMDMKAKDTLKNVMGKVNLYLVENLSGDSSLDLKWQKEEDE